MSVATSKTYRVVTSELVQRTYLVTTPGDEVRAAELAESGDYGLFPHETVENLDDQEEVCDCSVIGVCLHVTES